jgi:hypothetical protein
VVGINVGVGASHHTIGISLLLHVSNKRIGLKVPSGQIGSAREWYHWIELEKDINRYRFFYFIFNLEYLIRKSSKF